MIYGYQDDELNLDQAASGGTFNYTFDHCLIKTKLDISDPTHYISSEKNKEPYFKDPELYEFQPDSTLSAVIDKGSPEVINSSVFDLTKDLLLNSRVNDQAPDLGAYEFNPAALRKR